LGAPKVLRHAIRLLARDFRVPLLFLPRDRCAPVQVGVVELAHFLHAVHEAREFLELRPLVVSGAHRHADLDGLLRPLHGCSLDRGIGLAVAEDLPEFLLIRASR